jgi:LmbE family N-acetylglucosaminyl deacetylase
MSTVLVISPHPDDEAIGCGGTLRRHVLAQDDVHVVFLTSGEAGGHGVADAGAVREAEASAAADILGITSTEFWRTPDGALRAVTPLVDWLRAKIGEVRPDLIYVPHEREMHRDHRAAARLLKRALSNGRSTAPDVLAYEVWTPLERMDEVVDITPHIEDKLAAIRAYKSQCDVLRFDDAFLGLARYRGEMFLWPGGPYAEVFAHVRGASR